MRAEEDDAPEAARDWLADLQELLLTGGYFRARIAALAPFDKARAHGPAVCAAEGAHRAAGPACSTHALRPAGRVHRSPGCTPLPHPQP